eukprot:892881-Prorocentrum_minimum.AAC.2
MINSPTPDGEFPTPSGDSLPPAVIIPHTGEFPPAAVVVGMFIGDLTDEDMVVHKRSQSLSALFFG